MVPTKQNGEILILTSGRTKEKGVLKSILADPRGTEVVMNFTLYIHDDTGLNLERY